MKKAVLQILFPFLGIFLLAGCGASSAGPGAMESSASSAGPGTVESDAPAKKILVAYFSLQGHSREIAGVISDMTEGDLFEIEPVENYLRPDIEAVGKKQVSEGYKPELKTRVADFEKYDLIFVGSPVWWFSVTPPVMSFLSQYDFKDKKVVPFCTYKSDYGDFFKQFEEACKGAKVLKGRDFTETEMEDMEKVKEKIGVWLKETGCR